MLRRSQEETSWSEDFECGGYIYRKPIHVSPHSMQEGHSMGVTLSLIVIFNLALAHHFAAVQNSICQRRLPKALQLYKLAFQLYQLEEQPMQQVNWLHFAMIFANNLGEVHRTVNNRSKHMMFLQHLLSTIMYVLGRLSHSSRVDRVGRLLPKDLPTYLAKAVCECRVIIYAKVTEIYEHCNIKRQLAIYKILVEDQKISNQQRLICSSLGIVKTDDANIVFNCRSISPS
jgi:hypothetical protein